MDSVHNYVLNGTPLETEECVKLIKQPEALMQAITEVEVAVTNTYKEEIDERPETERLQQLHNLARFGISQLETEGYIGPVTSALEPLSSFGGIRRTSSAHVTGMGDSGFSR